MLFALCPSIRSLELHGSSSALQEISGFLRILDFEYHIDRGSPTHSRHLLQIESATLKSTLLDSFSTIVDLIPFLKMSSLRSLSTSNIACDSSRNFGFPDPAPSLQVLELAGFESEAMHDLQLLLEACGNLRYLSIAWLVREDAHTCHTWPGLGETIRSCCSRMETLRLDNRPRRPIDKLVSTEVARLLLDERLLVGEVGFDFLSDIHCRGLGDLRSLTSLTSLTITETALRGDVHKGDFDEYVEGSAIGSTPAPLRRLLPASSKHLTIVCRDQCIRDRKGLLQDSFIDQLDECFIINGLKTHWYSETSEEGGVDVIENDSKI